MEAVVEYHRAHVLGVFMPLVGLGDSWQELAIESEAKDALWLCQPLPIHSFFRYLWMASYKPGTEPNLGKTNFVLSLDEIPEISSKACLLLPMFPEFPPK